MDQRKLDLGLAGMDIKDDTVADIKTARENKGDEEIGGCIESGCRQSGPQHLDSFSDTFF